MKRLHASERRWAEVPLFLTPSSVQTRCPNRDGPTSRLSDVGVLFTGWRLKREEERGSPVQNLQVAIKQPGRTADDPRRQGTRLPANVLQRAEELGNVSAADREAGISRTLFYRWRRRFVQYGADGLHPRRPAARPGRPSQLAPIRERRIIATALAWLTWDLKECRYSWRETSL